MQRYIHGSLLLDIIAWFPFNFFIDYEASPNLKWLFTVKVIRCIDGFELMDIRSIMKSMRKWPKRYADWRI